MSRSGYLARLLRPIVRVLLANKVTYATFDQIARQVFVEVADKDFTLKGRKQTVSRVALVTGLSRKEVLRIKREPALADRELGRTFHLIRQRCATVTPLPSSMQTVLMLKPPCWRSTTF